MRAVVYSKYGSPDVLSVADVARPAIGAGDVLVRVHATAVGPADSAARAGSPYFSRLFFGPLGPRRPILGSDFAGEVEAVGTGVTRFSVGDKVFGATGAEFGTHAEYVSLSEDAAIAQMPDNLSYAESVAIVGGALTALPFLRDNAHIKRGQRILINGASGSVGTAAVQLAKHFGAHVTAVCSTANIELVKSLGADEVIDYTRGAFTEGGKTYDVIFDAVGKSSFARCRNSLALHGIYISTVPSIGILLQMARTSKFGSKKAAIAFTGLRSPGDKANDLLVIRKLATTGRLVPVIETEFPLERIDEAYELVDGGHKKGNIVVTVTV
jgi:NADPH:quinone reductase-like Zn-dependent oxidoreductase